MKNLFFIFLVFLSAISISGIAAAYSIIGLATLFAGAKVAIIAMGTSLEVGKLVAASWLYQNWKNPNLPQSIKAYLTTSVIVLVFVTSMGIFGFLSKAHLDQVRPTSDNAVQIQLIDKQILSQEVIISRAEGTLNRLDKALDVYISKEYVSRGLKERRKQKEERDFLNNEINIAMDKIAELTLKKGNIELDQLKIEADVGPLKYVAELIYGDEAKDHFDEAVRWIIIVLIFVFDPLAVLLLIAANISLRERKLQNETKKIKEEKKKNWQQEAARAKATAQSLRDKQKFYKTFFAKLGKRDLKNRDYEDFFRNMGTEELMKLGLDPDEIRIKLDQIMEWNDKPKV
jgi:hypothetical protein|tara:strand:+ start:4232 stop:5263 length:1032 start_codon:yes stop_codon:yes gene_type:complete